ncbi:hypothetical protein CGCSCA1_v010904 [Colletotrichum siamense]|nr:hypothetical protein CGCSCA1_v010904 [Colletotrichum siamense]
MSSKLTDPGEVQLKASFAFCVVQAQLYPDPVLLNLWYKNYYTAPERQLQHTTMDVKPSVFDFRDGMFRA